MRESRPKARLFGGFQESGLAHSVSLFDIHHAEDVVVNVRHLVGKVQVVVTYGAPVSGEDGPEKDK